MRKQRKRDFTAELEALHARVHPPQPAPSVAEAVRQELARQRAADAEAERQAEEAKLAGGSWIHCGRTSAVAEHPDGTILAEWHSHARGVQCGTCVDWRDGGGRQQPDEWLYDMVAAVLTREGLRGLAVVNRKHFEGIAPGGAAENGVQAWIDSGQSRGDGAVVHTSGRDSTGDGHATAVISTKLAGRVLSSPRIGRDKHGRLSLSMFPPGPDSAVLDRRP